MTDLEPRHLFSELRTPLGLVCRIIRVLRVLWRPTSQENSPPKLYIIR